MANRLLRCSVCREIIGTYPKYCPYCGGAPMTTDADPRIVEVPGPRPKDKKPVNMPRNTDNWWEPKPRVTPGAAFVPPPQSPNAQTPKEKAPKTAPQRVTPPKVKVPKTKEERIIDMLSAGSTAIVFAVAAIFAGKYYFNRMEGSAEELPLTESIAAEEIVSVPVPETVSAEDIIDDIPAGSDEENTDDSSAADTDDTELIETYECDHGSFEINTRLWKLNNRVSEDNDESFILVYTGDDQPNNIVVNILFTGRENGKGLSVKERFEGMSAEMDNVDVEFGVVSKFTDYDNAKFTLLDNGSEASFLVIFKGYNEVDILCGDYSRDNDVFEKELLRVIRSVKIK